MKIVHELRYPDPQVSCDMHPYHKGSKERPDWNGARVEVMVVDCRQPTKKEPFAEGESFHFEGDVDAIRLFAQDLLEQLDMLEKLNRRKIEQAAARSNPCPICGFWATPEQMRAGHGDGRGMSCFGDGTVRVCTFVVIQGKPNESVHVKDLKKGDRFLLHSGHWPMGLDGELLTTHVFEALEDGTEDGVLVKRP